LRFVKPTTKAKSALSVVSKLIFREENDKILDKKVVEDADPKSYRPSDKEIPQG